MAEYNEFYRRATYYDIVFNRDVTNEIDFVMAVYRELNGRDPKSLLDLACGPAYHSRNFALRGLRAVGLDLRPEMIAFAQEQASAEGAEIEFIAADMRDFQLDEPVDMAINVFDGIDCLTENRDLVAHLKAIGANLTPGGLYLLDVTHPRETSFNHYRPFRYHGERDGVTVDIYWATNNPTINPVTSISETELELRVNDNGEQIVIKDCARERILSAQEIALLAELSGAFDPVGWYGAYDFAQPLDSSPQADRMIAVLQKRA